MLAALARMLLRRWMVVVLITVIAVGAGAAVSLVVKPDQQTSAQVLFVPSLYQPGVPGVSNPFLQLGGSTAIVASVVATRVADTAVDEQLRAQGATGTYTVVPNLAENAGPVLIVTVTDKSAAVSLETMKAVLTAIAGQLRALQLGQQVPGKSLITSLVLTSSKQPKVVRSKQVQDIIIAAFVVFFVLIIGLVLYERRRAARSTQRPDADGLAARRRTVAPDDTARPARNGAATKAGTVRSSARLTKPPTEPVAASPPSERAPAPTSAKARK